jgi:glycosyltransferase involved in cell wall biosynthesis
MKINKLNFIGYIGGNSGYSVLSRALINLIDSAGIDIRVQDLSNRMYTEFQHYQTKDVSERFQLLHQIPTVMPNADAFYTVTEFDEPTYGSISPLRRAKLILTESEFCKEVFENFSKSEIHVIHYPIDPMFKPDGPAYKFPEDIEKFRFKFLSVFEWVMRKDPYTLIEAFTEEFNPEENVCLILRCWSKFRNPRKYIGEMARGSNVFWLPQDVPNVPALFRACDGYVTSTWGEGFGHPIAEAMACGLKVIAPASTGINDYLTSKNGIPIPVVETEVGNVYNEIPHLIKPYFKCWKPDKEALKKAMRKAFQNDMKFVRDNAVKIRDKYSIDNVLKEVKEAFDIE